MGETLEPITPRFNRSLRVECREDRLTGEPGAVLLREILESSGIMGWLGTRLKDPRRQADVLHDLPSLLRTAVLLAAQGWRDHDDADALRLDLAMRLACSSSAGLTPLVAEPGLASPPTLSRFTAIMAQAGNLEALRDGVLELAARGLRAENGGRKRPRVTLDIDSLPIEVQGHQPKAAWNGHYNARIYHPLVTSIAETGDILDGRLRPGNVGTADGALDVILDGVDRAQGGLCKVAMVRMDAGFPSATLLAGLEARNIDFVARLRANPALDRLAAPHMKRPRGRRPHEPRLWTHVLQYRAESWEKARRVILVVKERPDELLLDRFFLVTALSWRQMASCEVLDHYRARGKAEAHMGELKDALDPALSSTNRPKTYVRGRKPRSAAPAIDAFACNEVRMLISMMAYQLMHIARRAMARATGTGWSLRRLRERVLRAGARLIISARRMTLTLSTAAAGFWAILWPEITALQWAADP